MIDKEFLKSIKLDDGNIVSLSSHAHNAGWYNAAGKKIGWGDLSSSNLKKIISNIPDGDIMLTLYERDSFWNFVKPETLNPISGNLCKTESTAANPGLRYLADKAFMLIERDQVWRCSKFDTIKHGDEYDVHGLSVKCIGRKEMAERVGSDLTVCPKCSSLNIDCDKAYNHQTKIDAMQLFCFDCSHSEDNPYG